MNKPANDCQADNGNDQDIRFVADERGNATLDLRLDGRTAAHIKPH